MYDSIQLYKHIVTLSGSKYTIKTNQETNLIGRM